jgi:hypothetical protein
MDYRVFDLESRAALDTLELHVLARAYYAAWRAVYGTPPESRHPMPMFNVYFDFEAPPAMPLQHGDSAALESPHPEKVRARSTR